MFANLVANGAGSFASGLAGSRALAAATGTQSFVQHCFINSFDVFTHNDYLQKKYIITCFILPCFCLFCKDFFKLLIYKYYFATYILPLHYLFDYSLFKRFYPYYTDQKITVTRGY